MDNEKPKNKGLTNKEIELIDKLSAICHKYSYTPREVLVRLKEIKDKEVKDE